MLDRSLPDYLTKMLEGYEAVVRSFFGLDLEFPPDPELEDRNLNRFAGSLAAVVRESAASLVAPAQLVEWRDGMGTFPAGDLNRFFGTLDLVAHQLEIEMARADLATLQRRRLRVVELASVVIEQRPKPRTGAYLARAAKCYTLDLLPESVIMCRSALEAAFEDRVGDPLVREHLSVPTQSAIGLWHRIDVARKLRLLEPPLCDRATRVKRAGNDAVHNVPLETLVALDAIRDTLAVIDGLN